jgi:hypothetical protein
MDPETIYVFEDWACMVRFIGEAIDADDWGLCSECLRSGGMAIAVNGIPRVIDGTVH